MTDDNQCNAPNEIHNEETQIIECADLSNLCLLFFEFNEQCKRMGFMLNENSTCISLKYTIFYIHSIFNWNFRSIWYRDNSEWQQSKPAQTQIFTRTNKWELVDLFIYRMLRINVTRFFSCSFLCIAHRKQFNFGSGKFDLNK